MIENPLWRARYKARYKRVRASLEWQRTRNFLLRKYQFRCMKCGHQHKSHELQMHEIIYGPHDEFLSEWAVMLCEKCHNSITHMNRSEAMKRRRKVDNYRRIELWVDFVPEWRRVCR